jgi:hypothetical protein
MTMERRYIDEETMAELEEITPGFRDWAEWMNSLSDEQWREEHRMIAAHGMEREGV